MVLTKSKSIISALVLALTPLFTLVSPSYALSAMPVTPPPNYTEGADIYMYQTDYGSWISFLVSSTSVVFEASPAGETLAPSTTQTTFVPGSKYEYFNSTWTAYPGNSGVDAPALPVLSESVFCTVPVIYNDPDYPSLPAFYLSQYNYTDLSYPITNGTVLVAPPVEETSDGIVYNDPLISTESFTSVPATLKKDFPVALVAGIGVFSLLFSLKFIIPFFKSTIK